MCKITLMTHALLKLIIWNNSVFCAEKTYEEDYREKKKDMEQTSNKFVIWSTLGSCVLVVGILIAVVVFVIIKKRRKRHKGIIKLLPSQIFVIYQFTCFV